MTSSAPVGSDAPASMADRAYAQIKQDIFDFRLIPGDRFSENAVADRLGMSRTPVRDALSRLQREGYVEVHFRNGWSVRPFDFDLFEHLYDLRMVLETTAVRRLCEGTSTAPDGAEWLHRLENEWLIPAAARASDHTIVGEMDEGFHTTLVTAAGNPEIARVHREVMERIRIIRRFDFTMPARVDVTYGEHAHILRTLLARRADQAVLLLRSHIEASKTEVRKITLHRLYEARRTHSG